VTDRILSTLGVDECASTRDNRETVVARLDEKHWSTRVKTISESTELVSLVLNPICPVQTRFHQNMNVQRKRRNQAVRWSSV